MRRMYSKPQLLEAVESESKTNGIKVFEDIKDKDGHARFIEGELELNESVDTKITKAYGKWSLSGTHLLIVLCLNVENGASITAGNYNSFLSYVRLPEWIMNKIVPLYQTIVVPYTVFKAYATDGATQNIEVRLNNKPVGLLIESYSFTATTDRLIRVQFDLLIDNE